MLVSQVSVFNVQKPIEIFNFSRTTCFLPLIFSIWRSIVISHCNDLSMSLNKFFYHVIDTWWYDLVFGEIILLSHWKREVYLNQLDWMNCLIFVLAAYRGLWVRKACFITIMYYPDSWTLRFKITGGNSANHSNFLNSGSSFYFITLYW